MRDVLIQRAHAAGAALVVAGFARTEEEQLFVEIRVGAGDRGLPEGTGWPRRASSR